MDGGGGERVLPRGTAPVGVLLGGGGSGAGEVAFGGAFGLCDGEGWALELVLKCGKRNSSRTEMKESLSSPAMRART